jgi:hypothetical protein
LASRYHADFTAIRFVGNVCVASLAMVMLREEIAIFLDLIALHTDPESDAGPSTFQLSPRRSGSQIFLG